MGELEPNKPEIALLNTEQIDLMAVYVKGPADHGRAMDTYESTIRVVRSTAEAGGYDPTAGEIIVTAAAIGALHRSPADFDQCFGSLRMRLITTAGLEHDDSREIGKIGQGLMKAGPRGPGAVAEILGSAQKYIQAREAAGSKMDAMRMVLCASGFAATDDPGLRGSLMRDLSQLAI